MKAKNNQDSDERICFACGKSGLKTDRELRNNVHDACNDATTQSILNKSNTK